MANNDSNRLPRALSIVSVSAELSPFSKTGGLGEAARMIPKAIAELGHAVSYMSPLHSSIKPEEWKLELLSEDIVVPMGRTQEHVRLWKGELEGIPVYFIDHQELFGKASSVYLMGNDNERYFLFCHAVFAALEFLQLSPHILHAHDWHTGLVPCLLKNQYAKSPLFSNTASVYTIHNLAFQMEQNWWEVAPEDRDNGSTKLPNFTNKKALRRINFALRAIRTADALTTVSENYAREILSKEFGENLHRVLSRRTQKLSGILHGVDYETYNPATDPGIAKKYDASSIKDKEVNKRALQRLCGLPELEVPVIGMVSRITEQKGFELILQIMEHVFKLGYTLPQIVIMGKGDGKYERQLARMSAKYKDRFAILPFAGEHETLVYAGADIYLMPSRFEPCGLGQLISLRYGAIPLVHAVGGLAESIVDYDPENGEGNGFTFAPYNAYQLFGSLVRALVSFRHRETWENLVQKAMKEVFSWEFPAKRYEMLFRKVLKEKGSAPAN